MDWSGFIFFAWLLKSAAELVFGLLLAVTVLVIGVIAAFTHDWLAKHGWTKKSSRLDERILRRLPQDGTPQDETFLMMELMNLTDSNHSRDWNRAIKRLHRRRKLRQERLIRYGSEGSYLSLVLAEGEELQRAA